jgi:hypothetical protein
VCVEAVNWAKSWQKSLSTSSIDNAYSFTSAEFIPPLLGREVLPSVDGRNLALGDLFIKRIRRTPMWEEIYIKSYSSQSEACTRLRAFCCLENNQSHHDAFRRHNSRRPSNSSSF